MPISARLLVRFRLLVLASLLFAAMVSGAAFPVAMAQSAAPAVNTVSQPAATQPAADEDPNDVYRHSATVRWIARSFHTSTESAARTFEAINFIILALAIVIPLARILPGVLRRRSAALREQFDSTRKATEQSNSRMAPCSVRRMRASAWSGPLLCISGPGHDTSSPCPGTKTMVALSGVSPAGFSELPLPLPARSLKSSTSPGLRPSRLPRWW